MLCFIVLLFVLKVDITDCSDETNTIDVDTCQNSYGLLIENGEHFTPLGSDPCTQCTCVDGKRERCRSLLCSPIKKCEHQKPSPDKCCEFVCIDLPGNNGTITINKGGDNFGSTDSNLRLVASTFTSVLILALLMFMIYRLRKHRLMVVLRRVNNEILNNTNNNSSQRYSVDGDIGVGYFVGRDQIDFYGYDDPPPPYTLWKPPNVYIPPGEAPPPYEASLATAIPSYNSLPENNECSNLFQLPCFWLPPTSHSLNEPTVRNENITNACTVSPTLRNENNCELNSVVRYDEQPYLNFSTDINHGESLHCVNVQNETAKNYAANSYRDFQSSWTQPETRNLSSNGHCVIENWEIEDTSSSSPSSSNDSTISPSSSESSSILDFSFHLPDANNQHSLNNRSTTLPKCLYHPHKQHRHSSADRTSNFDRTLQHLKKLSVVRKKQKSKNVDTTFQSQQDAPPDDLRVQNDEMTQSQCSTMSNPETSSWGIENLAASAAVVIDDEKSSEKLSPHHIKFRRGSSLHSAATSTDNYHNLFPTPRVHKKFNQRVSEQLKIRPTGPEESLSDSVVTQLSRSSSICSETGERKYYLNGSKSYNLHRKRSAMKIDNKSSVGTLCTITPYNSCQENLKENLTVEEESIKSRTTDSTDGEGDANLHTNDSAPTFLLLSRKHLTGNIKLVEHLEEVIPEKSFQPEALDSCEVKVNSDENVWLPLPQPSTDKADSESLFWENSQESKL